MNDPKTPTGRTDSQNATAVAAEQETDWEALKKALNNAIWMHAPGSTTLAQAEEAACRAISYIAKCHNTATKETNQ